MSSPEFFSDAEELEYRFRNARHGDVIFSTTELHYISPEQEEAEARVGEAVDRLLEDEARGFGMQAAALPRRVVEEAG